MTVFDLTGFQRDILYVIADSDKPHGLAIKKTLSNASGIEINHGRLYPNLDELVELDYVEKGQKDQRTNYYALTETGRQALSEHHEWGTEMLEEDDHTPSSAPTSGGAAGD